MRSRVVTTKQSKTKIKTKIKTKKESNVVYFYLKIRPAFIIECE